MAFQTYLKDGFDLEKLYTDIVGTAQDKAGQYLEKEVDDLLGLTPSSQTTVPMSPTVEPPAQKIIVPSTPAQTPVPAPAPTETGGGIMETVKKVPPWGFAGAAGLAAKYISKSWLVAAGVAAGTYLLTDKVIKK